MNQVREKTDKIISSLRDQLIQGWLSFHCAKNLHLAYTSNKIISARYFFAVMFNLSKNETMLYFSKLFFSQRDSISLPFLLTHAKHNPRSFQNAIMDEIKKEVANDEKILDNLSDIGDQVKEQRDLTIAHLDRKHINNPKSILMNPGVDMAKLESAYRTIFQILEKYSLFNDGPEHYILELEDTIKEHVDYLFAAMNAKAKSDFNIIISDAEF
jgi:hypothetical protein